MVAGHALIEPGFRPDPAKAPDEVVDNVVDNEFWVSGGSRHTLGGRARTEVPRGAGGEEAVS
jgi:hypothetical protein